MQIKKTLISVVSASLLVSSLQASAPIASNATLVNNPDGAELILDTNNTIKFANSDNIDANSTDLSNISVTIYDGSNNITQSPISAYIDDKNQTHLIFGLNPGETATDLEGIVQLDIKADTLSSNDANNSDLNITSFYDKAFPLATNAYVADNNLIIVNFSEPVTEINPANFTLSNAGNVNITSVNINENDNNESALITVTDINNTAFEADLNISVNSVSDNLDNNNTVKFDVHIVGDLNITPGELLPPDVGNVNIFEFDNDKNAIYSKDDEIYMVFDRNISKAEFDISKIVVKAPTGELKSFGTDAVLKDVNQTEANDRNISLPGVTVIVENNETVSNSFKIVLGNDANVSAGDIVTLDATSITALDQNLSFPLLAILDKNDILAQIDLVNSEFQTHKDEMPKDLADTIQNLLDQIDAELAKDTPDDSVLSSYLEQIYELKDSIGNEDAYVYGVNASKIEGSITLPSDLILSSDSECQQNDMSKCNAIFIDIMDYDSGEFLGSAMVTADNQDSFTLFFRELSDTETLKAVIQIYVQNSGIFEDYILDFSSGSAVLKNMQEVVWQDNGSGVWRPLITPKNITSSDLPLTLNIDLNAVDSDKVKIKGIVKVPDDFIPTFSDNEFKTVSIVAIDRKDGKWYRTEIARDTNGTNGCYPFALKVPKDSNITLRVEKMSNNEWLGLYLDDDENAEGNATNSDHSFDGDEKLVSENSVMWKEALDDSGNPIQDEWGGTLFLPEVSKSGFFEITQNDIDYTQHPIDLSSYGNDFYKIRGTVILPQDFTVSDYNHINIDVLDAKTGWYLAGSPVICDTSGCTYNVTLSDTLNDFNGEGNGGYIIRINQDHWDPNNWEDSWWKGYFFDLGDDKTPGGSGDNADTIKDEFDVSHKEEMSDEGFYYWIPEVNELKIASDTLINEVNISFNNYTAPTTYKLTGTISLPSGAEYAHIFLNDVKNYRGIDGKIKDDGTFEVENIKAGEYVIEVNYQKAGTFHSYLLVDDDGDFSLGVTAVDSFEVMWIPYDSNGNSLEAEAFSPNFDWNNVAYWAPKVDGKTTLINIDSDFTLSDVSISEAALYKVNVNVDAPASSASKNVYFNLFVPNKPIGRWEQNITDSNGDTNISLTNLPQNNSYYLSVYIDGLGEYWWNGSSNSVEDDVYWIGKYESNGTICDDWQNNVFNCDWNQKIVWTPNVSPINLTSDQTINMSITDSKYTLKADFDFDPSYNGKTVDVNIWQNGGSFGWWEEYKFDANGDINVSTPVKSGSGYRVEIWMPETNEGYVANNESGSYELITMQNSWNTANWGPKTSTLINVSGNVDLGTLTPPLLKTVNFIISGLETNSSGDIVEDIFIALENNATNEFFGDGNYNWMNGTYSNIVSIKVPIVDGTNQAYRVLIHSQKHKAGYVDANGDGSSNAITVNSGSPDTADIDFSSSAKFTWNMQKFDTLNISNDTNITVALKTSGYVTLAGTVNLGTGDIEEGWISAYSQKLDTGSGTVVDPDGTFKLEGLDSDNNYTIEYWAWNSNDYLFAENIDLTSSNTNFQLTKPSVIYDINGSVGSTITNGTVMLIDINTTSDGTINSGSVWEVLDVKDVNETDKFTFYMPQPKISHAYIVAVGVKTVDTTSGATTFSIYKATRDENVTTDVNNGNDSNATDISDSVAGIDANSSITIKLDISKNQ